MKARIVNALSYAPSTIDTRRIGRLEQELRAIALDNAFGRIGDIDYLRRKTELAARSRPLVGRNRLRAR